MLYEYVLSACWGRGKTKQIIDLFFLVRGSGLLFLWKKLKIGNIKAWPEIKTIDEDLSLFCSTVKRAIRNQEEALPHTKGAALP